MGAPVVVGTAGLIEQDEHLPRLLVEGQPVRMMDKFSLVSAVVAVLILSCLNIDVGTADVEFRTSVILPLIN